MMLIKNVICQYKPIYATFIKNICHLLGRSPSENAGKNQIVLDFFRDSRMRVQLTRLTMFISSIDQNI